jgi:hypothetical protein
MNKECCNNDCRQGRDCPLRMEQSMLDFLYRSMYNIPTLGYIALVVLLLL